MKKVTKMTAENAANIKNVLATHYDRNIAESNPTDKQFHINRQAIYLAALDAEFGKEVIDGVIGTTDRPVRIRRLQETR